jgi:murein DD-endopeptidase MepM/ murein hydrolase activator NlpD
MKNLTFLMPLLFLATAGKAQFNTVSFENKVATIEVSKFDENHFQETFLNYHIEGLNNKKRLKEEKKAKELEKQKGQLEKDKLDVPVLEQTLAVDDLNKVATIEKKVVYKKLKPLSEENYEYKEVQAVYMPLNDMIIVSRYGERFHPIDKEMKFHQGVDLRANDKVVYAVLDGIVLDAGYDTDSGNYIKILHKGNFETIYLHLSKFYYKKDDPISAGDIIALSGNTGKSTAPHLHFAVKENGQYVDPIIFLNDLIQTNNAISDYGK